MKNLLLLFKRKKTKRVLDDSNNKNKRYIFKRFKGLFKGQNFMREKKKV